MKITCDLCGLEMKVKEKLVTHKSKKTGNKYRIRRFECVCGEIKTIFADGYKDEKLAPKQSIEDINNMYKQQEENNEQTN